LSSSPPPGNPSAEQQAIDRAHRIGQERLVTVIRFIIKDSVEERILDLQVLASELLEKGLGSFSQPSLFSFSSFLEQEKKRRIVQGAFAGGTEVSQQSSGLAIQELRQLFEQ